MPRRDGTGPMGLGSMTGRGLGVCSGINAVRNGGGYGAGLGLGLGCRPGFGRGFNRNINLDQAPVKTQKEMLLEQKELMQSRIDAISKQ
ncbi:MAG: DUF5320 domain-containing protein, partial [Saccharofermentanales bacterium]